MDIPTIDDLDVAERRVLVRADFNVPMQDGRITDTTRIQRTVPTLRELADRGARVVVLSHLGRPKGRRVDALSLRPVADALARAAGCEVTFADDCVGKAAERAVAEAGALRLALLENLRFHPGEEANDPDFARRLAALADVYVNDAFSCAHRAHASTEAVARLLPAAAGRLMQAELEALEKALGTPKRPVAAVIGGAKISTKLGILGNLVGRVELLVIGGGMANTFLHAAGVDVGRSVAERELVDDARAVLAGAAAAGTEVVLPIDAVVARELREGARSATVSLDGIPSDAMILDVGPRTVDDLSLRFEGVRTLVWNGPIGAFEVHPFDAGTTALARAVARLTGAGRLLSVAGGGDTVAALAKAGVEGRFSYVSTAGGAFLEWLGGRELPGVAVLRHRGRALSP